MRILLFLLALIVATPALAVTSVADVKISRHGTVWIADFKLKADAPVWAFHDSILPRESKSSFRADSWAIETPGVKLERHGWYDTFVSVEGYVPRKVRVRFTPYTKDIEASYDAALAFSDGSVALYDGKFKVVPMPSVDAVAKAPNDGDLLPGFEKKTTIWFDDKENGILALGQRLESVALPDRRTYVLFGTIAVAEGEALASVIDPNLPTWLRTKLATDLPRILASYASSMGSAPGNRPTLMVSWAGPTPGVTSMGGSVLRDMVVMTFEGDGVAAENPAIANRALWFIAHEAAHFWLGQAIAYDTPADSWITEGGADLLAFRATAAADKSFDVRQRLSDARAECLPFLKNGGIASAYRREGDFRSYYACGAIIALAAEQASGGDFADFVKTLIARNSDEIVTRAEWLALLDERAPGRGLGAAVAELLDKPGSAATLDAFIARARIADQFP